jgi:hypothetical protein
LATVVGVAWPEPDGEEVDRGCVDGVGVVVAGCLVVPGWAAGTVRVVVAGCKVLAVWVLVVWVPAVWVLAVWVPAVWVVAVWVVVTT